MSIDRDGLSKYVAPDLSEARVARQYQAIRARMGARAPAPTRLLGLVAVLACFVLAALALARRAPSYPLDGTTFASAESAGQALELPDRSRVVLGAESLVRLARVRDDEVSMRLERGRLEADVTPNAGRAFVVLAGDYEVRVVGTRFSVLLEQGPAGSRLEVRVSRGRVKVTGPGGTTRFLDEGEAWTSATALGAQGLAAPDSPTDGPTPSAAAGGAPPAPSAEAALPAPAASAGAPEPRPAAPTAKELFESAQAARAGGRLREAAAAFDSLRRRYRGDGRAALAAFELGRLRMDSFGDLGGAIEALSDAIALSPGAPFREDAEARRVQAMARSGRVAQCQQARDAYLARFPKGVHRAAIEGLCGGR